MPNYIPATYPLDLSATSSANRIVDEVRTFSTSADRLFVPSGGPFFANIGFTLRNNATGQLLLPGVQYKLLQLHVDATKASGKQVCVLIWVTDLQVSAVKLTYQVIGGIYTDLSQTLLDIINNLPETALGNVAWGAVLDKPAQFPPVYHLHHAGDWYGLGELVAQLGGIRAAIQEGDRPYIDAMYAYIEQRLADYEPPTGQQLFDSIQTQLQNYVNNDPSFRNRVLAITQNP